MSDRHTTLMDLLRHGEPQGGSRYRGHGIDDPLSELGWTQMWAAIDGDAEDAWTRIVSSPMARCLDFARAVSDRRRLPVEVWDDFKEVGFGAWEGRTRADLKRECPDEYAAFYADPLRARPAGAEPLEAFAARVSGALERAAESFAGERILLVTHAGVIRVAVSWSLRVPLETLYRVHVPFAGRVRLRIEPEATRLELLTTSPSAD